MTDMHACFQIGFVAGLGIAFVLTALFGWAFIAVVEGGDWLRAAGRVIAGWKRR